MNQAVGVLAQVNGASTKRDGSLVNYQGGIAYDLSLAEKVTQMARLGLIQNTFYEDEKFVALQSMDTLKRAIASIPTHVANEAMIGRKQYQMKFMPVLMLVYLSLLNDSREFERAFPDVILTAKDLHVFLDLVRKGGIRQGTTRKIRRAINAWLNTRLTEKMATRSRNMLKDIIKCSRPNPSGESEAYANALTYIAKGELTLPRAVALKDVLASLEKDDVSPDTIRLIDEYRMELEELKSALGSLSTANKQLIYEHFIPHFGYAALTINLVNIERAFRPNLPAHIKEMVQEKLSRIDEYKRSRMLPFGLITARQMTSVPEWKAALDSVIQSAVSSAFGIQDRVLVAVDGSGSMRMHSITPHLTAADASNVFGAVVTLSNVDKVDLVAFGSRSASVRVNTDNVFELADDIERSASGGTYMESILRHYNGQKYVLIITDNEQADNFESKWARMDRPDGAKVIVWQTVGYPHKLSKRDDVVHVYGYSMNVLNLIKGIVEG